MTLLRANAKASVKMDAAAKGFTITVSVLMALLNGCDCSCIGQHTH